MPESGNILRFLVCKDIFLCGNILREIPVDVKMVGRQIGDHGNVRAVGHGHQLEGAQFQYGNVLGLHPTGFRQKWVADVPPQMPSLPVTAIFVQGQTSKKTSISLVRRLPLSTAAVSSGRSGRIPGVRKITS